MNLRKSFFLFVLSFSIALPSVFAEPVVVYKLSKNLDKAKASIKKKNKEVLKGSFAQGEIIFPKLPRITSIKTRKVSGGADSRTAISLLPIAENKRRIKFTEVTPGSHVKLSYYVEPSKTAATEPATLYLSIWAGRHKLDRLVIVEEAGWHEKKYELGMVGFLLSPITLSFELTVDQPVRAYLNFDAEVIR